MTHCSSLKRVMLPRKRRQYRQANTGLILKALAGNNDRLSWSTSQRYHLSSSLFSSTGLVADIMPTLRLALDNSITSYQLPRKDFDSLVKIVNNNPINALLREETEVHDLSARLYPIQHSEQAQLLYRQLE